jgi:hypothetical protein
MAPRVDGLAHPATGLVPMAAVVEAAVAQVTAFIVGHPARPAPLVTWIWLQTELLEPG